MALATSVVAAVTVAATTAATVGAVVGAVGVGLTLVGMATKNKSLMKIGKIAGIAGGALTLGAFAVSGAASAFAAEGGILAATPASAASGSAAQTLAQSSIESTAGALTQAGDPISYAMNAGAAATGAADASGTLATAATTAGGMSTSTEGLSFAGKAFGPARTPEQLAQQTLAGHPDTVGFEEFGLVPGQTGGNGGANVLDATKGAFVGSSPITGQVATPQAPSLAAPQAPTISATAPAAGMIQSSPSAPAAGAPQAPAITGQPAPVAGANPLQAKVQSATDSKGFFGSLSPGEKAMLLSATVQGVGGLAGGVFGGIGQANQAKLQRWVAEEQFKRGSYAPKVSFQSQAPKGAGMMNQ